MPQMQILKISCAVNVITLFFAAMVYAQTYSADLATPSVLPNSASVETMGVSPQFPLGNSQRLDPEMRAILTRRLQNLRLADAGLADEIQQVGGESAPGTQPLVFQRREIQRQIQDIERQIGSPTGTASPTAAANPVESPANLAAGMGGIPVVPGAILPPQNINPTTGGLPYPYPPTPYTGLALPYNAYAGNSPQNAVLEQLKQGLLNDLRNLQHTLAPIPQNDPVRPTLEAQQADLLRQLQSVNQQLGTPATLNTNPQLAAGMFGAPTSVDALAADAERAARNRPPTTPPQTNTSYLAQLQNAERALRASGNTAMADDLLKQIQQAQNVPLPPEVVNGGLGINAASLLSSPPVLSAYPQPTSETTDLKNAVSSLRDEVSSLKEEIKTLKTLLQQLSSNNPPEPAETKSAIDETLDLSP
ncbi:MAG: hypothetical protein LBT05_03095 [Planctomycetaceae bacterium]|jgi:hypothetical protein|nr:hypothetical protein [Planctomycetaceae bacterium]